MATALRSIGGPNATTPSATLAPVNDNTAITCWTQDPRARLLLASCAANPPAGEWKRSRFALTTDEWFEYVGYRAEALTALRDDFGHRALMAYHVIGEAAYPAFNAYCRSTNVTDAIDAALNATLDLVREG